MAKHTIILTDEQEVALQYGFDNGGTQAKDLDTYASEWLGSLLDQYGSILPQKAAEDAKQYFVALSNADPVKSAELQSLVQKFMQDNPLS